MKKEIQTLVFILHCGKKLYVCGFLAESTKVSGTIFTKLYTNKQ